MLSLRRRHRRRRHRRCRRRRRPNNKTVFPVFLADKNRSDFLRSDLEKQFAFVKKVLRW